MPGTSASTLATPTDARTDSASTAPLIMTTLPASVWPPRLNSREATSSTSRKAATAPPANNTDCSGNDVCWCELVTRPNAAVIEIENP